MGIVASARVLSDRPCNDLSDVPAVCTSCRILPQHIPISDLYHVALGTPSGPCLLGFICFVSIRAFVLFLCLGLRDASGVYWPGNDAFFDVLLVCALVAWEWPIWIQTWLDFLVVALL